MDRSFFRPAIALPVFFVLLVVAIVVISNIFEISIGLKSNATKNGNEISSAINPSVKKPGSAGATTPLPPPDTIGRDAKPPEQGAGDTAKQPPLIRPVPVAFLAPYGDLMSDIGVDDDTKQKALGALQSFDSELKQQMNAAVRGGTPPSPDVFMDMETRRDEQLLAILGKTHFEAYKQNIDTIPERAAMGNLQTRLERAGAVLTKDQSDKLFQCMVEAAQADHEVESGTGAQSGKAAIDKRFEKVSEALRKASSDLTDSQKVEINRFIDETKEMRSRLRRKF